MHLSFSQVVCLSYDVKYDVRLCEKDQEKINRVSEIPLRRIRQIRIWIESAEALLLSKRLRNSFNNGFEKILHNGPRSR